MKKRIMAIVFATIMLLFSTMTVCAAYQPEEHPAEEAMQELFLQDGRNGYVVLNYAALISSQQDSSCIDTALPYAQNIFNDWASKNLIAPRSAYINSITISKIGSTLVTDEFTNAYLNFWAEICTEHNEDASVFSEFGWYVMVDYSAQNKMGGYVRDELDFVIFNNGTQYITGDPSNVFTGNIANEICQMGEYSYMYSGQPFKKYVN